MRLGIMQPYFLPYIGYFQLIEACDCFIIYDNIKYTKKGWINRNRILQNGHDEIFSIPLKKDSDNLSIKEREISDAFNKKNLISKIQNAYQKAPYFEPNIEIVNNIINFNKSNLFEYLNNSITIICAALDIQTEIKVSSTISIDHTLRGQEKVISLCKTTFATDYINPIGGVDLYSKEIFADNGLNLSFLKSHPFEYPQLGNNFVPWLSIIDVMMFNSPDKIRAILKTGFDLI